MEHPSSSPDFGIAGVLAYIKETDDIEINQILNAVTQRYSEYYPDWDILFLSLPKNPEERRKQLERMLNYLKAGNII